MLGFEDVALLLLISSWLSGALARRPAAPLHKGDSFSALQGAAAVSTLASSAIESASGFFNHGPWLRAASRAAASKGCDVRAFAIWRAGRIARSLALRIERWGGFSLAFPVADPLAQYTCVQGEGSCEGLVDRVVLQLRKTTDVDALVLSRVPTDRALAKALNAAGAFKVRTSRAPYIDLTKFSSYSEWVESFGTATRKSRRNRLKKFESAGSTGFRIIEAGSEAVDAARRLVGFKRWWIETNGLTSRVLDDDAWTGALLEVVASPESGAVVSCLCLNGDLVAGEVGFVSGDTYLSYLGAYDPAHANLGVGTLQIMRTVGWCFEQGIRTVDLLPPADDYKLRWTTPDCQREVADYILPLHKLGSLGASLISRFPAAPDMFRALAKQFG